jgi:hypothetical protein
MAKRLGIEVSARACRIIDVDDGSPWRRLAGGTRVSSFAVLPPSGPRLRTWIEAFLKRPAAIVVWGVPAVQRQVIVNDGPYDAMRREALAALSAEGIEIRGVLADIAETTPAGTRGRRPVAVTLAPAEPMREAIKPFVDAGIRVHALMTPAAALASLARTRRTLASPDALEAYVALEEVATCIALVRNGALVAARELPWGFMSDPGAPVPGLREEMASRLATELDEFFGAIGAPTSAVSQVCLCGGMPELRSMSVGVMEQLDVEVEPLDSLYGIDPLLPAPVDEFRERCAEMRVAWAIAADRPPVFNLLRPQRRRASRTLLTRAAVAGGVAAGLVIGWQAQKSDWWRSMLPKPVTRTASNVRQNAPGPRVPVQTTPPIASRAPEPATGSSGPAPPSLAPARVPTTITSPPMSALGRSSSPAPALPRPAGPPTVTAAQPAAPAVRAPQSAPPVARTAEAPPPRAPAASTPTVLESQSARAQAPSGVERTRSTKPAELSDDTRTPSDRAQPIGESRAAKPALAETPLPFAAILGGILYSADRQLAIIDGQIVAVGDEIRGAQITEITTTTVFLRDPQGRLRRLALGAAGR